MLLICRECGGRGRGVGGGGGGGGGGHGRERWRKCRLGVLVVLGVLVDCVAGVASRSANTTSYYIRTICFFFWASDAIL